MLRWLYWHNTVDHLLVVIYCLLNHYGGEIYGMGCFFVVNHVILFHMQSHKYNGTA